MSKLYWIVARDEFGDVLEIESGYSEFTNELKKRGIDFQFIPLNEMMIHQSDTGEPQVYCQGERIQSDTAFIISCSNLNAQAMGFVSSMRHYFRITGIPLLNESIHQIELMEWDKVAQMAFTVRLGAPVMPYSLLGYHKQVVTSVKKFIEIGYQKLIFKPVGSSMGFGIIRACSMQEAISAANLISTSPHAYFVMPFLEGATDVRFYFINHELTFIKIRKPEKDGYLGNVYLGAEQEVFSHQEFVELISDGHPRLKKAYHLSKKIEQQVDCSIIAIDWLMNQNSLYFNEMSTAQTGLTKLPAHVGVTVFDRLSELTKSRINAFTQ